MEQKTRIAEITDAGTLGVFHMKRHWSQVMAIRNGDRETGERNFYKDRLVIDALGLGLLKTQEYLFQQAPTFEEFEQWVVETAGVPDEQTRDRVNADLTDSPMPEKTRIMIEEIEKSEDVLSSEDLKFWENNGYVVLKNAVSREACKAAEQAVWEFLDANPDDPRTWYGDRVYGIMVELYQHPAIEANRHSPRIRKAFSQLWGTADLWVSADRCGFNPPETQSYSFSGPDLHWDVDFDLPFSFATQGILYLTDTPPEQGAFTLVPGFHHRYLEWMESLPAGVDPQKEDLHALGSTPIGGEAGDLIIWHHALPHGSRPNRGTLPRMVQYINYYRGRT